MIGGDPPAIIVHGTEDALVSFDNTLDLVEELKFKGVQHELIAIEGAGHTPQRRMDIFAPDIARFLFNLIQ